MRHILLLALAWATCCASFLAQPPARATPTVLNAAAFGATNVKNVNTASVSKELLTDLIEGKDLSSVPEKIEALEAAHVPFRYDRFYGAPWRVLYVQNTVWQRYFAPFRALIKNNRAYQWYKDPKDGYSLNVAQALGKLAYVTVFANAVPPPKGTSMKTPFSVTVDVERAMLTLFGAKIPLNFIKGRGVTMVTYQDDKLRIFRSDTGGLVVQTKAEEEVPV